MSEDRERITDVTHHPGPFGGWHWRTTDGRWHVGGRQPPPPELLDEDTFWAEIVLGPVRDGNGEVSE